MSRPGSADGPGRRDGPPRPPLDLRLAVAAVAGWVGVLASTPLGAGAALVVGAVAACATVAVVVVTLRAGRGHRSGPRARGPGRVVATGPVGALGLAAAGLALTALPLAARLATVEHSPLAALRGRTVTAELTVGEIHRLAAGGVSPGPRVLVAGTVTAVRPGGVAVSARSGGAASLTAGVAVFAPAEGWDALLPGARVRVVATVASAEDPFEVATLSARGPPQVLGPPPVWGRAAAHVRAGLVEASAVLPDGPRGLLPGLVVGDTTGLDPVLEAHFRAAGLTHLVAVSGTNCAIVVGAGVLLVRRLRAGPVVTAVAGAALLAAFVLVAGPSPSVVRAAVMATVGLGALAAGRPTAVVPALSAAVLVGLVWRPALATDAGFTMSVAATAAIVLAAPALAVRLRRHRVPVGLAEAVAVAVVAHLVTAPVAAALSGSISVVAVPANIAAEPVVAVTTVLGFLAAVLAAVHPALGVGPAWLAGWPLRWLVAVADTFGTAPGATTPWWSGAGGGLALAGVTAVVAVLWRWRRTRPWVLVAVLVAAVVQVPVRAVVTSFPPTGWWFVACDVGQGDGLVLRAGDGTAVVVDTGPDPVAADACLRTLGIDHVALLLLTHMDLDHVGGVAGVVRGRDVEVAVTSPHPEPPARAAAVRAALAPRGVPLRAAPVGSVWRVGAVTLEFLAPRADELAASCDPNDCSVVTRASVDGHRVLLTADESTEAQDRLLSSGVDLTADVLKVPHHGSRFTDPAFLAAVHARLAVVSVGADNRYGHPAPATVAALTRLGLPVLRTDLDGSVAVASGPGGALAVTTSRRRPGVPVAGAGAPTGPSAGAPTVSEVSVTMGPCRPPVVAPPPVAAAAPPPPTPSTTSWPAGRSPRSCCCSATRNCWCRGPPGR